MYRKWPIIVRACFEASFSVDIHGYQWKSMDIHAHLWISMEICGYLWTSMDIHRNLWISRSSLFFSKSLRAALFWYNAGGEGDGSSSDAIIFIIFPQSSCPNENEGLTKSHCFLKNYFLSADQSSTSVAAVYWASR